MNPRVLLLAAALLAGCATPKPAAPQTGPRALTVMVHDSFALSEPVLKSFETTYNVKLTILKSGDAGAALNKAILSANAPIADVFYGVDNTFLSRALKAGIFEPYASPALANIPDRFKLDSANRVLPVDYAYVSLNVEKDLMSSQGILPAQSLKDLTRAQWQDNVVVENAATSSTGLAFLLTTIAAFPEGSAYPWQQFWRDMVENKVHVSPDWNDAYYNQFIGTTGVPVRASAVSYATSPAAEVFYSEGKKIKPSTASVDIGAFEQIEFVGVLKGAKSPELARAFVDFLLSPATQADIPTQMWVYPVLNNTPLPDVFKQFAPLPTRIYSVAPDQIDAHREAWIKEWSAIVAAK